MLSHDERARLQGARGVLESDQDLVRALFDAPSAAAQEQQGLDHAHQLLAALAHVSCVRDVDPPGCDALFAEIVALNPRFAAIGLVLPDGEQVAGSVRLPPGINARGRVWYERVVQTRRPSIGTYAIGRATGRPSIHIAQPMMASEKEEMTSILVAAIVGAAGPSGDLRILPDLLRLQRPRDGPPSLLSRPIIRGAIR